MLPASSPRGLDTGTRRHGAILPLYAIRLRARTPGHRTCCATSSLQTVVVAATRTRHYRQDRCGAARPLYPGLMPGRRQRTTPAHYWACRGT